MRLDELKRREIRTRAGAPKDIDKIRLRDSLKLRDLSVSHTLGCAGDWNTSVSLVKIKTLTLHKGDKERG